MWTCPNCNQKFLQANQRHSCGEKTIEDFLKGRSVDIQELFWYFIKRFRELGDFELHPAKHRIAFAGKIRFGYVHRVGREFIDIVLHFEKPFYDNFCFHKIAGVPEAGYNHYIRLYNKEDINEEVLKYLALGLATGNKE